MNAVNAWATASALITPAPWVCLDLETGDAPPEAVLAKLDAWQPPGNVSKPETIEAKRNEARKRIMEQAALLDNSPILCVGLKTPTAALLFDGMTASRHYDIEGWNVVACGDERTLLLALRQWLDSATTPETEIVGHHLRGFDLPKLRQAYLRHRLQLPALLRPGQEDGPAVYDTMQRIKSFSMEWRDERYIALDTVCQVLGIDRPKQVIDGAQVPALAKEGRYAEIATYCCIDTAATTRAYLLMTNQAADLE